MASKMFKSVKGAKVVQKSSPSARSAHVGTHKGSASTMTKVKGVKSTKTGH